MGVCEMALGRLLFEAQELVASAALTCALSAIDVTLNGGPGVPSSSTYDRLKQAHTSHDGSGESSQQWLICAGRVGCGLFTSPTTPASQARTGASGWSTRTRKAGVPDIDGKATNVPTCRR